MPPRQIGPYRVVHPLGSGGVGTVYRAVDLRTDEAVALKLLSSGGALDPLATRRFAREFETLRDLVHPNIVRVFDAGVWQGYPYLAMELVEGLDLKRWLDLDGDPITYTGGLSDSLSDDDASDLEDSEDGSPGALTLFSRMAEEMDTDAFGRSAADAQGPGAIRKLAALADESFTGEREGGAGGFALGGVEGSVVTQSEPVAEVDLARINRPERIAKLKDVLLQVCEALAYVHQHGLVHRDIKPANIIVDEDRHARLLDFGLAKFLAENEHVTASGKIVGTYRYMAPEQLAGETLDHRADLYSLGVCIYELSTGRVPFSASNPLKLWEQVANQEAPGVRVLNPGADPELAQLAARLLRKDPKDRFQTAEEVFRLLLEA